MCLHKPTEVRAGRVSSEVCSAAHGDDPWFSTSEHGSVKESLRGMLGSSQNGYAACSVVFSSCKKANLLVPQGRERKVKTISHFRNESLVKRKRTGVECMNG